MEVCTVLFVRSRVFSCMTMCCSVAVCDGLKERFVYNLRARMSKKMGVLDPQKGNKLCFFRILETSHSATQCQIFSFLSTVVPCVLILLKFSHQLMHEFFKRSIKIYIKTAPTCFGVITLIRERTI